MNDLPIIGPGSQPAESDGADIALSQLPSGMGAYVQPALPEPEAVSGLTEAMALLSELGRRLHAYPHGPAEPLDLAQLDEANKELVDQVLGEGEVSIVIGGESPMRIQESVLAGVWRVQRIGSEGQIISDAIEIGPIPQGVVSSAFASTKGRIELVNPLPEGVVNAPPLFTEINEQSAAWRAGNAPHVINLTLLPQTEEDLAFLDGQLGPGSVTILSRGYGNCRISSSGTRNVWWVQYFNSQERNILNSLEISDVPSVACAAPEDIADSAQRLDEIMEIYR